MRWWLTCISAIAFTYFITNYIVPKYNDFSHLMIVVLMNAVIFTLVTMALDGLMCDFERTEDKE